MELNDLETYEGRVAFVLGLIKALRRDFNQAALTRRVSLLVGRKVLQQSASQWYNGVRPRDPESQAAFARALGADPGWLYFAPVSAAPSPTLDAITASERRMTDEDLAKDAALIRAAFSGGFKSSAAQTAFEAVPEDAVDLPMIDQRETGGRSPGRRGGHAQADRPGRAGARAQGSSPDKKRRTKP